MEITCTVRQTSLDRWTVVTHVNVSGHRIARHYNIVLDSEIQDVNERALAQNLHAVALDAVRTALRTPMLPLQ